MRAVRFAYPRLEMNACALLNDVGKLVRQKTAPGRGLRSVLARAEHHIPICGECKRSHRRGSISGSSICVNADAAEISPECRFHGPSRRGVQRSAG